MQFLGSTKTRGPRRSALRGGSRRTTLAVVTGGALALAALAVPTAAQAAPAATGCSAVEFAGSRGTTETAGLGSLIGLVAQKATAAVPGTTTWANPYPASADYLGSVSTGVADLKDHLTKQAAACPSQQFVLGGYSQGAEVTVKTLTGGLPANVASRISAVVLFGNPEFVAGEPFDVGTYAAGVNGVSPRAKGSLDAFKTKIRDDCRSDDMICQAGKGSVVGHLGYITDTATQTAAADFVKAKVAGGAVTPAPGPTTPTTPTTPPTTPTTPKPAPSAGASSFWSFLQSLFGSWFKGFGGFGGLGG